MVCSLVCLPFLFPQIVALPTEGESFTMNEYDPRTTGTEKKNFKTAQFQKLSSINQLDSHEKLLPQATLSGFHLTGLTKN